jgi:thioredoxin-related protein
MRRSILILAGLLVASAIGAADERRPSAPQAIDIPKWFTESFLDLREDVRDAAKENRRVMLYFGQDGCPYCKALMKVNFGESDIVEKTRRHFVAIALNLWGDREVTWIDGRKMPEKELARALKVQYTPTLLFLDERGQVALRLNGYVPPEKFRIALDYAAGRMEGKLPYAEYLAQRSPGKAADPLGAQSFVQEGTNLARMLGAGKPLAVLFEQKGCRECDELHREGFARPEVRQLIARFTVAQLDLAGSRAVVAPDGGPTNERDWAGALRIGYAPSIVFFDAGGKEVFRVEGYLRPFHLASVLDYVAGGGYREEPSFQRFIQKRADTLRAAGKTVDLWK